MKNSTEDMLNTDMQLLRIDNHALQCRDTETGTLHLGFITGIPARNLRTSNTLALRKSDGIIIRDDALPTPWPIEKFIAFEDKIVALGPWIPDTQAWELTQAGTPSQARPETSSTPPPETPSPQQMALSGLIIPRILPVIKAISQRDFELKGFLPMAFRTFPDKGILVCPLKLAEQIRKENIEDNHVAFWQHPEAESDSEKSWVFFLGLLAWKILTGEDPFKGAEQELRRERIRRGIFPHILTRRPGTNPNLAQLVHASLSGEIQKTTRQTETQEKNQPQTPPTPSPPPPKPQNRKPKLHDWFKTAPLWREETSTPIEKYAQQATANNRESRKLAREAQHAENQFRFQLWFRQWRWPLVAVILILSLSFSILSSPLKKWIQGPVTVGLTPLEVTQRFYQAMDEMDVETMRDCLTGKTSKTSKKDLRMIELLYVTNRIRLGMEGHNSLIPVAEWMAQNRPPLSEGTGIWGITDLKIQTLDESETLRFEARYSLWIPGATQEPITRPQAEGRSAPVPGQNLLPPIQSTQLKRKDILHLAPGRRAWEIISIERIETTDRQD